MRDPGTPVALSFCVDSGFSARRWRFVRFVDPVFAVREPHQPFGVAPWQALTAESLGMVFNTS